MASQPDKLGAVKLHKILWYADGEHYARTGVPITSEIYKKNQFGPFAVHLSAIVEELEAQGSLTTGEREFYGQNKKDFIGKGEPDTSVFTEKQLRILDDKIDSICFGHTANSISEKSHNEIWAMAEMGEVIPYEALIAKFIPVNADDVAWARAEIERIEN